MITKTIPYCCSICNGKGKVSKQEAQYVDLCHGDVLKENDEYDFVGNPTGWVKLGKEIVNMVIPQITICKYRRLVKVAAEETCPACEGTCVVFGTYYDNWWINTDQYDYTKYWLKPYAYDSNQWVLTADKNGYVINDDNTASSKYFTINFPQDADKQLPDFGF